MNKKILLSTSLLLMISFSTGIFVEIISTDNTVLSSELPIFGVNLFRALKSDIFLVLLSMFFSLTIFFMPCVGIIILCKTFSLGFSTAYLFTMSTQGTAILLAVLLPRTVLKLPIYITLFFISYDAAKQLKALHLLHRPWRKNVKQLLLQYAVCLIILMSSTLLEVFLLRVIL